MNQVSVESKRSPWWWVYFGYCVLAFAVGSYEKLATPTFRFAPPRLQYFTVMSVLFDAVALVGLYGFLRYKPLASPAFWTVFSLLFLARMAYGLYAFAPVLARFQWQGNRQSYLTLLSLAAGLLGFPALVAFWLYAFRSPEIWRRRLEV